MEKLKSNLSKLTTIFGIFLVCFVLKGNAQTPFSIENTTFKGKYDGSLTHNSRRLGPVYTTASLSQYGGWTDVQLTATGHFRTEKYNGVWYMVDPDGYLFFGVGANSVNAESYYNNVIDLPQDLKTEVAFNHLANWSKHEDINSGTQKIPYTFRPSVGGFLQGYKNTSERTKDLFNYNDQFGRPVSGIVPVFDPGFSTYVDNLVATEIAPIKNDPYCIGVFSDNELQIYDNFFANLGYLLDRFLDIPNRGTAEGYSDPMGVNDPNYIAAHNWMIARHGTSSYTITAQDRKDFHGYLASTYYKICYDAIKTHAPNMLYLGSRLHSAAKDIPEIFRDSAPYVDIFSVIN